MRANVMTDSRAAWMAELESEGELEALVSYAKEKGLCWEIDPDMEVLEVEIRMSGSRSVIVRGHEDEVEEAFRDEPDDYCEIDEVEVSVHGIGGADERVEYEVVDGKIRRASEGDEMIVDGQKVAAERERMRGELRKLVEYYAPLGRSAAIGRARVEIMTQIEGKAAC